MAGYTRQSSATIIAGANVTAAIFNAEFNQLQSAFNGTTGHGHTGGTGDGPKLVLTAAAAVSGILPLDNGGTGYGTRIEAYDNFHVIGSDIAVGSTVDLSTSDGDYIEVTGTGGTITSFGTGDIGIKRTLYFSGASNTITHNGTSLICPNGVNITVKAGEQIVVRSLGSGNWIVELLMKNSSAALGNLTLAADKLPYMSSTTAMSLADLTTFGRSLIDDTDAATARTTLGLGTISTQDSNNVSISGGAITGITDLAVADGGTGASTAANARTNLGLVIGTNVQAWDAELSALAGLTSAADKLPYFTGSGTAAVADFTSFGRQIVDDANAGAVLTTLGISSQTQGTWETGTGTTESVVSPAKIKAAIDALDHVKQLETGIISAVTTKAISLVSYLTAGYTKFRLHLIQMAPVTDGAYLVMDVSSNNGGLYFNSNYINPALSFIAGTITAYNSSSTSNFLLTDSTGNAAGEVSNCVVDIEIYSASAVVRSKGSHITTAGTCRGLIMEGFIVQSGVNNIRFYNSSGNMSSGSYELYGIK